MSSAFAKEFWRIRSGFAPRTEIDSIKEDIRKMFPLKSGWKFKFSFDNEQHFDNKLYVEITRSPIKFDFPEKKAIRIIKHHFIKSPQLS